MDQPTPYHHFGSATHDSHHTFHATHESSSFTGGVAPARSLQQTSTPAARPPVSSPMSIKSMISTSILGPGGIDILNADSSPDGTEDIFMTEYHHHPPPQPPRYRALSEEMPTSERVMARDWHDTVLSGSLPTRDARTGYFHFAEQPTPSIASSPISYSSGSYQQYDEFRRQSGFARSDNGATPAQHASLSPLSSPSSGITKMNLGDKVYSCTQQGCRA
ncbi:hypothetical protein HDU98_005238, partial [Podochytrium sp. JEL0797]